VSTASGAPGRPTPLKRAISRNMLLFFVVGDVVGAGIYALVGQVAGRTGGAVWTAFLAALVLALFTALSYAELVTKYPGAGGAGLYVNRAYGKPFLTFVVTFMVMMSGIASAATLSRAFGGAYLRAFVSVPTVAASVAFLALVALINFRGISESVRLNVALTCVEVAGLLLIVAIGLAAVLSGVGNPGQALEFKHGTAVPLAILGGAYLAFYALIGFEDSANVSEEAVEPARDYPRALLGGLLLAGLLYMAVAAIATMAVPVATLRDSSGPLLEVVGLGPLAIPRKVFSAIALLAVANGALINLIMASRLLYGMSDQGVLPAVFSRVHAGRRTPWVAIVFTTVLAMALAAAGDLSTLADTTVFLLLVVFAFVNTAVLVLRRDDPGHAHFRTPSWAPVLGVGVSLLLIGHTVAADLATVARAGALIAIGVALFFVSRLVQSRTGSLDPGAL
jgi:basic amino acid/polyamine antiporter, APA family